MRNQIVLGAKKSANQEARSKRNDRRPARTNPAAAAPDFGARPELPSAGAAAAAADETTARPPCTQPAAAAPASGARSGLPGARIAAAAAGEYVAPTPACTNPAAATPFSRILGAPQRW